MVALRPWCIAGPTKFGLPDWAQGRFMAWVLAIETNKILTGSLMGWGWTGDTLVFLDGLTAC